MLVRRGLVAFCAALCCALPVFAAEGGHDFGRSVEAQLAPSLSWIVTEKFRASYNWSAPPELYEEAKACGLNAIISRLDIANDPSGDVDLGKSLKPGDTKPIPLRCYDLVQPSSRRAKELGLHWFFMVNPGAFKENFDDGLRGPAVRVVRGEGAQGVAQRGVRGGERAGHGGGEPHVQDGAVGGRGGQAVAGDETGGGLLCGGLGHVPQPTERPGHAAGRREARP